MLTRPSDDGCYNVFWALSKECQWNIPLFCLTLLWNTVFHRRRSFLIWVGLVPLNQRNAVTCWDAIQVGGLCVSQNLCILISWQLCCPGEEKLRKQLKSVSYHHIFQRMELVLLSSLGSVSLHAVGSVDFPWDGILRDSFILFMLWSFAQHLFHKYISLE